MSQFEFIAVLVSVIVGLGIVHLLRGVALFFTARERHKPYWVHLLWTWNVFHYIVFYWWFLWRWTAATEWHLALFLFVLIYAIALYLMTVILYPSENVGDRDFRQVFQANRRPFFALWILLALIDVADTRLKMAIGLDGFGTSQLFAWGVIVLGSLIAMRVRSEAYNGAWAIMFFCIMGWFELMFFPTLRAF